MGVVLAVEKRITSPLMVPSTIEKIVEIDTHLACAFSGLTADSKMLIERARVEAQSVSNLAIQFGDSDSDGSALSRPFGVALLFAGCDPDHGSQLFHMDPSGTYVRYDAKAIGSGSEGAQQSLQEVFHKGMTLKEAIKHAMTILKQVMEEKLSEANVEVATVTKENGYQSLGDDDLQTYIKDLS